ncbi:uncharacterized protein LOC127283373 isoform X1 [Leptopilina boulardi]|uniref:uncharacterized protein LOC127283373 isoform X1 n=1 Tax=Leptopilina boulardi TaxID=63433 RepID=UPI0021F58971|nr:uncharacterized protein LOC127283373 isoform X1 [Leptopilina boulardi]
MESKSSYLDAIQGIPGNTAKEKYESLNKIINQTIENKNVPGDLKTQTIYGTQIPKVLEPLIQTEIAKIEKKSEDIIAALKSDDAVIINRALQADWIFDGSIKSVTNFNFFSKSIFPEVSLNTRAGIIKRLSQHLGHKKEYILAQEFFEGLEKLYNLKQAKPLLSACSEIYLAEIVKNKNISLSTKLVNRLFSKYPELVINYFKFGSPAPNEERVVNKVNINDYKNILPKLIKNYVNDFVDIINSQENNVNIKLGKKCAEYFLESKGIEALISKPLKFIHFIPLKTITKKLNKEQFELMFQNLFPKKYDEIYFDSMIEILKFQPDDLKLPLILNSFKKLYGIDPLTLTDIVTIELLLILPSEERIKIARKKLETEPEGNYNWQYSWICYLPCHEAIPIIKNKIAKTKKVDERIPYIGQLLYNCKVNKSDDDLFQVLQYFSSKHRNEISYFWTTLYNNLMQIFVLETLNEKIWQIINEMIQRSYVKNLLMERIDMSENLLEKSIHHNLLNNLSIDDKIIMLTELKIKGWNSHFCIIQSNQKYERICLEKFLDIIPRKFVNDDSIWEDNKLDTIKYLIADIYDYNNRMKQAAKKKNLQIEEELSIKNYPWLLDALEKEIKNENNKFNYKIDDIKKVLLFNDRKLYDSLFPDEEKLAKVDTQEGLNLLKRTPEKIIQNWEKYLESCEKNLNNIHTRKFLKKSTWYSQIPIKFFEESLKKLQDGNHYSIMILALLLPGSEFTILIQHLAPNSEKMDIDNDNARMLYLQTSSIPDSMNEVNPPPSLELVEKFCQGDYLQDGLRSLMNIARRVSAQKVILFASTLIQKPISVKKHGIRLLFVVAPSAKLYEFLRLMWTTEKHKSIREVVFEKSYQLFCNKSCNESWDLIKDMIETLTVEDRELFNHLTNLENIPNEYIRIYFELALKKVDDLQKNDTNKKEMNSVMLDLTSSLTPEICHFFTEDYCQYLLKKLTFNFEKDELITQGNRNYAVNIFLADKNKLDSRLNYFCNLLSSIINEKWNKSHPRNFRVYPIRSFFSDTVENFCENTETDIKILQSLFNLFEKSTLLPVHDCKSYLLLYFNIKLREVDFNGKNFATVIGNELTEIIKIFSPEMLIEIGKYLATIFKSCERYNYKDIISLVIQTLVDLNSNYSSIVATVMLDKQYTNISDDLYKDIVEKLQKVNHPTVASILNKHINSIYF